MDGPQLLPPRTIMTATRTFYTLAGVYYSRGDKFMVIAHNKISPHTQLPDQTLIACKFFVSVWNLRDLLDSGFVEITGLADKSVFAVEAHGNIIVSRPLNLIIARSSQLNHKWVIRDSFNNVIDMDYCRSDLLERNNFRLVDSC